MEKYRARRFGPKKIQHDGGCGKKISGMETSHWRGVFKKPKILVLSQ